MHRCVNDWPNFPTYSSFWKDGGEEVRRDGVYRYTYLYNIHTFMVVALYLIIDRSTRHVVGRYTYRYLVSIYNWMRIFGDGRRRRCTFTCGKVRVVLDHAYSQSVWCTRIGTCSWVLVSTSTSTYTYQNNTTYTTKRFEFLSTSAIPIRGFWKLSKIEKIPELLIAFAFFFFFLVAIFCPISKSEVSRRVSL